MLCSGRHRFLGACSLQFDLATHTSKEASRRCTKYWASLALLKSPFIMILFLVTFIDATVHQCYFVYTGGFLKTIGIQDNWVASVMSVGQVAEIITMTILGMVLANGWRTTMILGVLGHVIRFGVFALAPTPSVVVTVILLHGSLLCILLCHAVHLHR
ncbi:MAG: MFS transporter [Pirellulales bacterium]